MGNPGTRRASGPLRGWWGRLTDVDTLELLVLEGNVDFVGWGVLARTVEGEGEDRILAGFGLHGGRRGVACGGEEAKDNGKGEAFHGG